MAERERIIPIQIEGRESSSRESTPESDVEENKLSKSLEELSVDTRPSQNPETSHKKLQIQVKPAVVSSSSQQEYLKEFDVLEKREGNSIFSDYILPNMDTLEHIVLVIDTAQDENCTPFIIGNQKYTPLGMLRRAISIFIKLKHNINPHHEFAIIVMNESDARLALPFTNDSRKLNDCLNKLTECETEDVFDLNTVFKIIMEVEAPQPLAPGIAPPYVLRTIIFYGRSYTLPEITITKELSMYLNHPFFTCDILMTHEPVEASNHCEKIFLILQNLDKKGTAYFFPVCRDLRRLHRCTGKLLAHPLQRPIQKLIKS